MKKLLLYFALLFTTVTFAQEDFYLKVKLHDVTELTTTLDSILFWGNDLEIKHVKYTNFLAKLQTDLGPHFTPTNLLTDYGYTEPTHTFAELLAKPTTIGGYGITDFNSLFTTQFGTKSTTNLTEGTNLYYTEARVDANSSVVANTLKPTKAATDLSSKNYSYGESYITNWRDLVLDDGATYFPNNGGYEIGRLKELGVTPSLHFIPAAVKTTKIYSLGKNRINDLTVARASTATYVDEDGIIQTAAIDVARIDYTDGDGAFLIEPQSTNLYLNSAVMVTQDVTVDAVAYTVSFYGTGTITFSGVYTGSLVGTGANNLVSITFTPTAGTLTSTISGTVTDGQIELGDYASSRIITAGTTVTRLADKITGAGDVNTFNSEEGVLYIEMAGLANDNTSREITISDGTSGNRLVLKYNTVNQIETAVIVGGSLSAQLKYTVNILEKRKIALKWKVNDFALYIDGIEVLVDNSGIVYPINTLNQISLSIFDGSASYLTSKLTVLKVYKSISDAQNDLPYITN